MKSRKNKSIRAQKSVIRNSKRSEKNSKRAKSHTVKQMVFNTIYEIGPSLTTKTDKDGKTIEWNSWSSHSHQKLTKEAAMNQDINTKAKNDKKNRIKEILKKAGYDPTIKYTREEKKKFTRAVKANLFEKPKPEISDEQAIQHIKERTIMKKKKFDERPSYADLIRNLPPKPGKQRPISAAIANKKEKSNPRKFTYVINRVKEEDMKSKKEGGSFRSYDFMTDHFDADSKKNAEIKLKEIAKAWLKDESFSGITLKDKEGDNSIIFYSPTKLAA